jgi:hypothetical protein
MKIKLAITLLLACLLPAAALAGPPNGRHHQRGILYAYEGTLAAVPGSSSLTVDVETGNRPALQSLLGQSAEQTFSYDSSTEFLLWSHGVPTVVAGTSLHAGEWVRVNVRAPRNASLTDIEATAPAIVGDRINEPQRPGRPLFLFRGTLTGVGATTVTMDVAGGNRHALRLLIGQPASQTFTFDADTIVLLWQGKVPTVISPSQLKVGDRFVVRVRADKGATLAEVEATAARHLGDREPPAPAA